jgi:hypothetical protein
VVDARGRRHIVKAYLALTPGNVDQLMSATFLFGAVGIGFRFLGTASEQFRAGRPWTVVRGAAIDGGHYVPGVGRDERGNIVVVTWGKTQLMTPRFFETYCDEVIAYVSDEALGSAGRSREGFDLAQFESDLKALG